MSLTSHYFKIASQTFECDYYSLSHTMAADFSKHKLSSSPYNYFPETTRSFTNILTLPHPITTLRVFIFANSFQEKETATFRNHWVLCKGQYLEIHRHIFPNIKNRRSRTSKHSTQIKVSLALSCLISKP